MKEISTGIDSLDKKPEEKDEIPEGENTSVKKDLYIVKFHVEGQYTAYVKAASFSEVSELATEQWIKADFGDIHHVHGDIDNKTLFRIMIDAGLPITEIVESKILLSIEEPEARYAALAKNGMFVAVLKNWFNSGMKESPEMIGEMFNKFMLAIG